MVEMPQYIHLLFDIGAAGALRILQLTHQPFPGTRPIERISKLPREQFVQQDWMPVQVLTCPVTYAHELGYPLQRMRMLPQQRQIGSAPAYGLQQLYQSFQREVCGRKFRRHFNQGGNKRIDVFFARFRQL